MNKVVPIGPSFGIKIWNLFQTFFYAITHFLKFKHQIKNKREFLANYWRQYKRIRLSEYIKKNNATNKSVFFIGSLWKKELKTNKRRANFINVCKNSPLIKFEGGFAPRSDYNNFGYDDLLTTRCSLKEYLKKIQDSAVVFNTPAVLSCHGWKLGEFLALGKAIISSEHYNILPSSLNEGEHICYANSVEEIQHKLNLIITDKDFKNKLEQNSYQYFMNHLHPNKIIEKLISEYNETNNHKQV